MRIVDHKDLVRLLKQAYNGKVTPFIWGATGIGKSESIIEAGFELAKNMKLKVAFNGKAISQAVDKMKEAEEGESTKVKENKEVHTPESHPEEYFHIIDLRLSQFDPCDLRGLPYQKDGKTYWACPGSLPTNPNTKGILQLDEINLAPPLVQSSAYQLILDRRLGDYILPDGWVVVAAGNRAEDKAYTFELAGPLCNRFVHVELKPPALDDWTAWAIKNDVDPRIISFLQFKPDLLFKFDSKLKDKSFPTPRSWARACNNLIKGEEDMHLLPILIASAVGEGTATEMMAYIKLSKTISLKDVLANPKQVETWERPDLRYSLVSALVEYSKKNSKTTIPQVMEVFPYLPAEFSILAVRMIAQSVGFNVMSSLLTTNTKVATIWKSCIKYVC